jgi:hypothetical protein
VFRGNLASPPKPKAGAMIAPVTLRYLALVQRRNVRLGVNLDYPYLALSDVEICMGATDSQRFPKVLSSTRFNCSLIFSTIKYTIDNQG